MMTDPEHIYFPYGHDGHFIPEGEARPWNCDCGDITSHLPEVWQSMEDNNG